MKYLTARPFTSAVSAISLAFTTATFAGSANAQERVLEEVVVTAQKRTESSQDIPIAVSAFGSELMESIGITQTQDLVKLSPSLTLNQSDNKQNGGFSLRGIGTNVYSTGVEQSVAVIIDDVSASQAGQSLANLVDIERVEVLRGPQSTLFGKSASAGVISVITKAPAKEFEGTIEVTATDDDEQRVQGSISGPITDSLAFRLTGHWSDRGGFVNNLTIDDDVNGEETKGLRGKLLWEFSDTVDATLTAYYSEEASTISAMTWRELDPDALIFGYVPGEIAAGITPSDENLDFRSEDGPEDETENSGVNLRFNVGLGEYSLTSITAVDNWQYSNAGDIDFSDVDILGFFTGGQESGGFHTFSDVENDFFSQEFRLSSPVYENFDYLLGLYYADADTDRKFLRNPGLPLIPADWDTTNGTKSIAVFGQANWRLSDATNVIGGLRWNKEEITVDYVNQLTDPDNPIAESDSDSVVVGNLSVQHFLNEDVMLYARYARGYKGQAYDIGSGFDQDKADNPAEPETSDAYELGVKSMLLDNRLQLNATLFYTEYEDFQAQSNSTTEDGALSTRLNNVGDLETSGVELEGVALLGDNLTLTFGAAYIDATIKEFLGADCYQGQTEEQGCIDDTQNIFDGALPNSPEWKYSLVADYQMDMGSMPFYGFLNASYIWQDEVQFDLLQNPETTHDSYGVLDLSFGINEAASDRYRVTVFVNNVTDENYRSGLGDVSILYGGATALVNNFARNSLRYYGLRVKFAF